MKTIFLLFAGPCRQALTFLLLLGLPILLGANEVCERYMEEVNKDRVALGDYELTKNYTEAARTQLRIIDNLQKAADCYKEMDQYELALELEADRAATEAQLKQLTDTHLNGKTPGKPKAVPGGNGIHYQVQVNKDVEETKPDRKVGRTRPRGPGKEVGGTRPRGPGKNLGRTRPRTGNQACQNGTTRPRNGKPVPTDFAPLPSARPITLVVVPSALFTSSKQLSEFLKAVAKGKNLNATGIKDFSRVRTASLPLAGFGGGFDLEKIVNKGNPKLKALEARFWAHFDLYILIPTDKGTVTCTPVFRCLGGNWVPAMQKGAPVTQPAGFVSSSSGPMGKWFKDASYGSPSEKRDLNRRIMTFINRTMATFRANQAKMNAHQCR